MQRPGQRDSESNTPIPAGDPPLQARQRLGLAILICRKTSNPTMRSSFLYCKAHLFREIDITRKADASLKQSNEKFDSKVIKPLPRNCTIARIDTG